MREGVATVPISKCYFKTTVVRAPQQERNRLILEVKQRGIWIGNEPGKKSKKYVKMVPKFAGYFALRICVKQSSREQGKNT